MHAKKMMKEVKFKIIRDVKLTAKTTQGEASHLTDK
jgi:hypothetical protein